MIVKLCPVMKGAVGNYNSLYNQRSVFFIEHKIRDAYSQVTKIIDQLLGQYTISILYRYSEMTLSQYSFLENFVDIGNYIDPLILSLTQYQLIILSILTLLSCSIKEHWLNTQFLSLVFQYWLDIHKYFWDNIHFWKFRSILEKYIGSIIVLSWSTLYICSSEFR